MGGQVILEQTPALNMNAVTLLNNSYNSYSLEMLM